MSAVKTDLIFIADSARIEPLDKFNITKLRISESIRVLIDAVELMFIDISLFNHFFSRLSSLFDFSCLISGEISSSFCMHYRL